MILGGATPSLTFCSNPTMFFEIRLGRAKSESFLKIGLVCVGMLLLDGLKKKFTWSGLIARIAFFWAVNRLLRRDLGTVPHTAEQYNKWDSMKP